MCNIIHMKSIINIHVNIKILSMQRKIYAYSYVRVDYDIKPAILIYANIPFHIAEL